VHGRGLAEVRGDDPYTYPVSLALSNTSCFLRSWTGPARKQPMDAE
jgi:hypothetical protein